MNFHELRTLLDYHYWARDRLLDATERLTPEQFTRDLGSSFPSIRDTLVHIYAAEWVWCCRWEGESPQATPDPNTFPDVATVRIIWKAHEERMRSVLEGLGEEGVRRLVLYRTPSGRPHAPMFWQMLQHVVNHASYHRGQVTAMLRQLKASPPKSMDLMAFHREQSVATARHGAGQPAENKPAGASFKRL